MKYLFSSYFQRICRPLFVTLLLLCATSASFAQIAEGLYYIASYNSYNKTNHTATFYICPADISWASGQPYLTTSKNNQSDLFEVIKAGDYYYIKHVSTGKYLTINGPTFASGNEHRRRVHLEDVAELGEDNLFSIIVGGSHKTNGTFYNITHKSLVVNGNKYLNVTGGNQTYNDGGKSGYSGIIGLFNSATDGGSRWYFEAPPATLDCANPYISLDSEDKVKITCTTPSAVIYYTLDGSNPTNSATRLTYSEPFAMGAGQTTVKAVATRSGYTDSEVIRLDAVKQVVSNSSEITNMYGCYYLDEGFVLSSSIGSSSNPFCGLIDGGFNEITLEEPLVDYAKGATIRNIRVEDASIDVTGNAGAICSHAQGVTRIYNCGILSGTVKGTKYTGGIVGELKDAARVINCFSFADITDGTYVGGIVGYNTFPSTADNLKTMVMNCMFYGDITGGTSKAPIYNGELITNVGNQKGLNNYNYFTIDANYAKSGDIQKYNTALGAEKRFLVRFEQYRYLLNGNRNLAAYYATDDSKNREAMAKWVLDKSVKQYPILKPQAKYPSIINYDETSLPSQGTLTVNIQQGSGYPTGASIVVSSKNLTITDQDPENFNFNYHKVQLPYYNDVGTHNYTKNKVVTGWKIVNIVGGTKGDFVKKDTVGGYDFTNRKCTDKDLYSVSERVFAQGGYFDVPDGVTSITIQPYWAKCVYLSDPTYDVTYWENGANWAPVEVAELGTQYSNGTEVDINGSMQKVYTTLPNALTALAASTKSKVFDNAVVLVGNFHRFCGANSLTKGYDGEPFTLLSIDLDKDNEPDYSMFIQQTNRQLITPIRFDFINMMNLGMAHKVEGSIRVPNLGIVQATSWFEITNTCLIQFGQFEYDHSTRQKAPMILHGGVFDQFISNYNSVPKNLTEYLYLGENVWFKMFNNGRHANTAQKYFTKHIPISVSGGDYESFYLSGMFNQFIDTQPDDAECYISGGRFGEVAGGGMEQIDGNVEWKINHADIKSFYGGGVNAAKPIKGNITVTIEGSNVGTYCGGPKFGDMTTGKKVKTTASDCEFNKFFGAGYGGTSLNRVAKVDSTQHTNYPFNAYVTQYYDRKYNSGSAGVAVGYEYEHIVFTGFTNDNTVGRFYVNYASLSLATVDSVESVLTGCTIHDNFYGGGNLGKVTSGANSKLFGCTVEGDVYGAGFSADIPTCDVMPIQGMTPEPYYNGLAGVFITGEMPQTVAYKWHQVASVSAGNEFDEVNKYIYTTADLNTLGQVGGEIYLTVDNGTRVYGSVFGGGNQSEATGNANVTVAGSGTVVTNSVFGGGNVAVLGGNAEVHLAGGTVNRNLYGGGNVAEVEGTTSVEITGGEVINDVYGGGNEANVRSSVTVTANGGTVRGALYGGGALANTNTVDGATVVDLLGGKVNDVYGGGLGNAETAALVGGNVTVTLDGSEVTGQVFGCNNVNGSPQKHVKVHVKRTARYNNDGTLRSKPEKEKDIYEVAAVYGGGNKAPFVPISVNEYTEVLVEGCDETSVGSVYGGGNAASTPATDVLISGCYEIDYVFGGGNGAGEGNPGANVGYAADLDGNPKTPGASYGSGIARTTISGGRIHHVFGGSNTRGNIRETAVSMLDEVSEDCPIDIGEIFGAGNEAYMDGDARLYMGCVSFINELYGGSKNADIAKDIELHVTNGTFNKIFGGNKKGGAINGSITIYIEEWGCQPIRIGELYAGGNEAPYTTPAGKNHPRIFVVSATEIGTIFGGGYGESAEVVGNPYINVNMVKGILNKIDDQEGVDVQNNNVEQEVGTIGTIFGGGNRAVVRGNTKIEIGTEGKSAKITGNVYGGGNHAEVTGTTDVIIGKPKE